MRSLIKPVEGTAGPSSPLTCQPTATGNYIDLHVSPVMLEVLLLTKRGPTNTNFTRRSELIKLESTAPFPGAGRIHLPQAEVSTVDLGDRGGRGQGLAKTTPLKSDVD